jgi:hypothetical protein
MSWSIWVLPSKLLSSAPAFVDFSISLLEWIVCESPEGWSTWALASVREVPPPIFEGLFLAFGRLPALLT